MFTLGLHTDRVLKYTDEEESQTEKTPRREIELALTRAKLIQ